MKDFIVYLCAALLAVPSPALEASPANSPVKTGLTCVADRRNQKNPYHRMKEANDRKIQVSIQTGNLEGKKPLPRQEMMRLINESLGQICTMQEKVKLTGSTISLREGEVKAATAGPQGCEAYNGYSKQVKSFDTQVKDYQVKLNSALKDLNAKYNELIRKESQVLNGEKANPGVRESFRSAWGKSFDGTVTEKTREAGAISSQMLLIQEEAKANEERMESYKGLADTLASLKDKCPTIGDDKVLAGAAPDPKPGTLPEEGPIPEPRPGDGSEVFPPPGPDTPTVEDPEGEKKGGLGGWAARNKGVLILGAGAAAVGGLLWYKNKKDKEDDRRNALPIIDGPNASSTDTAVVTNTITDANGFTLSANGFPPSAAVGQTIGPIVITVHGPSGGQSPDGAQITLSCVSSCPISGTLTKTVSGGKAEFNDISFTAAKTGVQLKASAPGMNGIVSPGSFNVAAE